jgi:hypothetical protein
LAAHDARSLARRTGSLALALGVLLAAPAAGATSDPCAAPPGTAAVDQYCESTPGGVASTPHPGARGDREPAASVPSDTADRVLQEPGGAAVLQDLPGAPAAPSRTPENGDGGADAAGGAGGASPSHRSSGQDRAEPAPHGTVAGLTSSADSILSTDMRDIIAILAVTLLCGLAFAFRRGSRAGV